MKLPTALHYFNQIAPANALSRCARCKSDDVFDFDGDLFCNPCGWNSIEARVESQLSELTAKHRKAASIASVKSVAPISARAAAPITNAETTIEAHVA